MVSSGLVGLVVVVVDSSGAGVGTCSGFDGDGGTVSAVLSLCLCLCVLSLGDGLASFGGVFFLDGGFGCFGFGGIVCVASSCGNDVFEFAFYILSVK